MRKKIAFLTTQFNQVKSGPGRFTEYLRSLPFEKVEIHFFSQEIQSETPFQHPVPIPGWAQKIPFSSLLRAWYFNKAVMKQEEKEAFDWILAADYSMAMFLDSSLLKKTAVMVNDDNFLLIYSRENQNQHLPVRKSLSRKLGYFLEKSVVRKVALCVANSLYTKELIEKIYQIPEEKVVLLYKAVDLSYFSHRNRQTSSTLNLLFVKNDWRRGGLDLIMDALAKLDFQTNLHFRIAGILPSQQSEVQALIRSTGFNGTSEVMGLVNRETLLQLMYESDVFLNFSRQEALGVSCLEAMSSGLPVIGSDAGGLKEILAHGKAGFMVKNGDVPDLVNTLNLIHRHPELLQEKATFATRHVKTFSVQQLQVNLENMFG